jgi:chitodextrinase
MGGNSLVYKVIHKRFASMILQTTKNYAHKQHGSIGKLFLLALGLLFVFGVANLAMGHRVLAAACSTPSTDYGTDTMTVNVPAATTYVLWARIMVPDTTNNSINVQVDSSTCFNVGGSSSIPANTWTWVNYQNGATATPNTISLSAGSHTIKLIGTKPGVSVDRVILASDTSCTPTGTGDSCASGDSTPPTVSVTAPSNNASVSGNVTLSASASDASGIASVKFLVDGTTVSTDTSSPYGFTWNSAGVSNGAHTIKAQATDKAGNTATSGTVNVTVNNAVACSSAPSVPNGLKTTGVTSSDVSLSWSASSPAANCTIQGYKVYRGSILVTTVTSGTTYTDTGLTPGTPYSYSVAAIDTSGHTSSKSSTVNTTTSADTTPPSTVTGVHTTLVTSNAIALAWTASTDNVAVTGYTIYRNGTKVGASANATYTDPGLTPNTTYQYTVKAYDAKDNQSSASSALNATTLQISTSDGDLNSDHTVNLTDLSILLSHWSSSSVTTAQGDLNGDGKVTLTDLSILLSHWGQ